MTRTDVWKLRLMLHCSFNALFALERSRIIHEMMCPTKKEKEQADSR